MKMGILWFVLLKLCCDGCIVCWMPLMNSSHGKISKMAFWRFLRCTLGREGIKGRLQKDKHLVLEENWELWRRIEVIVCFAVLCGGRMPQAAKPFCSLEPLEFCYALCFRVPDEDLVVECSGWMTEVMIGCRGVMSSPCGWVCGCGVYVCHSIMCVLVILGDRAPMSLGTLRLTV
jgi:hypothetical protein